MHCSENCFVVLQGDLISGNIHKQVQITNRENVIEQIKIVSEMITSFCYTLSLHFSNVSLYNVSGNHSRIDRKEDALHDERLDDLIGWIVEKSLNHIENIHVQTGSSLDTGICNIKIRGLNYVAVHGDMDSFTRSGVQNLCTFLGYIPEAILYGHLHRCSFEEENGVKMVRSGSLAGAGDNYTIEKEYLVNRHRWLLFVQITEYSAAILYICKKGKSEYGKCRKFCTGTTCRWR